MATFLDPNFGFKSFPSHKYQQVKHLVLSHMRVNNTAKTVDVVETTTDTKQLKRSFYVFPEIEDLEQQVEVLDDNNRILEDFIRDSNRINSTIPATDALQYWKLHEAQWPTLAKLVGLLIEVSNFGKFRNFSDRDHQVKFRKNI
jgi:hypothetical protein